MRQLKKWMYSLEIEFEHINIKYIRLQIYNRTYYHLRLKTQYPMAWSSQGLINLDRSIAIAQTPVKNLVRRKSPKSHSNSENLEKSPNSNPIDPYDPWLHPGFTGTGRPVQAWSFACTSPLPAILLLWLRKSTSWCAIGLLIGRSGDCRGDRLDLEIVKVIYLLWLTCVSTQQGLVEMLDRGGGFS